MTNDQRPTTNHPRHAARDRLIVALDVPTLAEATSLVDLLAPMVGWFKVGSELFTSAGPEAVSMILAHGGRVFLDLKFHDIPNTVSRAVMAASRLGVAMMNVHIAGGVEMLRAAVEANRAQAPSPEPFRPLVIGVTLLTSHEGSPETMRLVVESARLAQQCGLDGVVASAQEARQIKTACGPGFAVVTPGIRPSGSDPGDQQRVATLSAALRAGADYLVIGRPILSAPDPQRMAETVLAEMKEALPPG